MGPLAFDPVAQGPDFIHALAAMIDKRSAHHPGVLHGIGMDLGIADVGIHQLKMTFGDISRRGSGRYEVRPGIPLIDERFYLNVLPQVKEIVPLHREWLAVSCLLY